MLQGAHNRGNSRRAVTPMVEKAKHDAGKPAFTHRLVIVDDNPDSAESMRVMFRLLGHDARVARDGGSVVELAASFRPDAVLLDIGLPDIDGYEVARRLRADPRTSDVLIIAITGFAREEDVRRSDNAGIDEHLVKPVDPDRLLERLARGRNRRNSALGPESHRINSKEDS
jgi:CheY-like chemotaxis protein